MKKVLYLIILFFVFISAYAQDKMRTKTFDGLKFRSIGPALASGRISDLAVDPNNRSRFFIAVSSGGVWKTENAGTTFTPIFDNETSYSIGCITMDPNNPLVLWVGAGENNSQRSVSYGDGVYKSIDGGKSWRNMGLKKSEHIAKILVDPRNSNIIYAASQGPLWSDGGDRGLFKSFDGGKTWKSILDVDKHTGVTDILFDPRNPDVIYAATYQRRRHVWTLINGGPGSALHKSYDAGKNWKKLSNGLPEGDLGRIGLAVSPVKPDVVYAIVEAEKDKQGFFRSQDAGENWEKMNKYISGSPQYYQEIVCDPVEVDRVYSMDTWMMVTVDGGKTWSKVGEKYKHVDNHVLWIDPKQPEYMLAGCDGGVYETFDKGATWKFYANLPITQFYRVTADNDKPFYNVYAGTQDNATLGGPSRNTSVNGIRNADWFVTVFGDGFETQIDPEDPNIIYSQYQYGGLVRFDKRSGEMVSIQPQPGKGEPALKWNWDSALLISPHDNQRLYFCANIVFRSDDRGNTWKAISPDLTRKIDRNKLKVMDKIWRIDAVAKNKSTSFFGNIVSFDESIKNEGLLYAGTDDGLIQISQNSGETWTKIDEFKSVPNMSYVSDIQASLFDQKIVYASFDNHKMGDFKPYLLKSVDNGKSWSSITGNLPKRGTVYSIAQDHVNPYLLFAGTEFGVFFTTDEGKNWVQLKGSLPTICVRDVEIQRRENDLVLGTFGRGIYIIDNYTLLREMNEKALQIDAILFPIKDALMYFESAPLGLKEKSMQGDGYYYAENPKVGAIFTYYLKDDLKTRFEKRSENEKDKNDNYYPLWEELTKEKQEVKPQIVLTIFDEDKQVIRRLTVPVTAGFHSIAWDMTYPPSDPVDLSAKLNDNPFSSPPVGPMVAPGNYSVSMEKVVNGVTTPLGTAQKFKCSPLANTTLPAHSRENVLIFQQKVAKLQRAAFGVNKLLDEMLDRIKHLKKGLFDTPKSVNNIQKDLNDLHIELQNIKKDMFGDMVIRGYSEPIPPSVTGRIQEVIYGSWDSSADVTETHKQNYNIAAEEFETVLTKMNSAVKSLQTIEEQAEMIGTPFTPGRLPLWKKE